ncbi:hypothetical protein QJS66_08250 [Kocuria rhizophila]|nr:hypothetical protein QJS66_08250 [Kocuria rhizophila]
MACDGNPGREFSRHRSRHRRRGRRSAGPDDGPPPPPLSECSCGSSQSPRTRAPCLPCTRAPTGDHTDGVFASLRGGRGRPHLRPRARAHLSTCAPSSPGRGLCVPARMRSCTHRTSS